MKDFAVILDLNGTLVDTEIAFFQAYKDVLAKHNIPFTLEQFTSHWSTKGLKLKEYLELIERHELLPREQEMLDEKSSIFEQTLEERAVLMPGARGLIKRLQDAEILLGLDSSSVRKTVDHILHMFNIDGSFAVISSGDMQLDEEKYGLKKKKSSRMKAFADSIGMPNEHIIVIGDAEKDIKGAKDAGMKALAVPNDYTKDNDFSLADKIVKTLDEVTPELLSSMIK